MSEIIKELYEVIEDRRKNPKEESYTSSLFEKGEDAILEKIGEESTELILAAKNGEETEIKKESADLIYHLLVLLSSKKMTDEQVLKELRKRRN